MPVTAIFAQIKSSPVKPDCFLQTNYFFAQNASGSATASAVNFEDNTTHIVRKRRSQEEDRPGGIFRGTGATQRDHQRSHLAILIGDTKRNLFAFTLDYF